MYDGVGNATPTMFMAPSEHIARHQVPALGGDLEPTHSQRLILLDALSIQQNLPEQRLSIEYTFAGGDQNRLRSARRAFLEHGFETITVEHFLTAQLITHTSTQRRNRL